ncbi:hypothetical protein ACO0LM_27145 [Undibacterium sp. Di26W]|uniref:hypothetical protein n=1 Tax=Undibacterium sp. Di26W TaxID=3413035 RepID=UPI003BF2A872
MSIRLVQLLTTLSIFVTCNVHAFDSWEHKRMGDLAYHVAIHFYCDENTEKNVRCKEWQDENNQIKKCLTAGITTITCEIAVKARLKAVFCKSNSIVDCDTIIEKKMRQEQCKIENGESKDCTKPSYKRLLEELSYWYFDPLDIANKEITKENSLETIPKNSDKKIDESNPLLNYTTYGDVVMCVDYFLTPDKLLAGRENYLIDDTDLEEEEVKKTGRGNPYVKHGRLYPVVRRDLDINRIRCKDDPFNIEGARSGHVNHSHFQAELIVAQSSNHMLALMLRTSQNNLFGALTANAISDHYLHDSFSPGHITTWRSRLTDLAANSFHDHTNRQGLDITVNTKTINDMSKFERNSSDLLSFIEKLLCSDNAVNDYLLNAGEVGLTSDHCGKQCMLTPEQRTIQETELKDFIRQLKNPHPEEVNPKVTLKGDNSLWKSSQVKQRLLMLISQTRSILDVLESKPQKEEENPLTIVDSFQDNSWSWAYVKQSEFEKNTSTFLTTRPSQIKASIGPITYDIANSDNNVGEKEKEKISYRAMDRVIGVSLGIDNMTFGDRQNRSLLSVETVLFGKASSRRYSDNWGVLAGYQQQFSPVMNGAALTSRYVYVKPEIEMMYSAQLRAMQINRPNDSRVWKLSIGARVDIGFTSFLTTYIQMTRDYAAQTDGRIGNGISIGAGIQLASPACRIFGISNLLNCN